MRTLVLLLCSNIFMTIAWYGHLRYKDVALWKVIVVSWLIAFFEYCLQVPANRIGNTIEGYSVVQLKVMQEILTLITFTIFSLLFLNEQFRWNYVISFVLLVGAVFFAFKK